MEFVNQLLGANIEPKDLNALQVSLRALVIFISGLIMMRIAHGRFLTDMSPLDVIIGCVLASLLSRAINGSSPLLPTIIAGFFLVLLHRLFARAAWHSDKVGFVVKGEADVLVRHGRINQNALKRHTISEKDLLEEARIRGKVDAVEQIELATIERGGQISIIRRENEGS